ncbi:MAG: hypothetical protein E7018_05040 [Alphaproteobacteria bacterium]|nr:hypothetical protein [Alphaproteobacteria bacterium]
MSKTRYIIASFLLCACFCNISVAQAEVNSALVVKGLKDNGTNYDGVMVIPKMIALHCDMSSEDAEDEQKIKECLDALSVQNQESSFVKNTILHQMYKEILEKSLEYKSAAGDYEDIMDKKLEDKSNAKPGSAALGGKSSVISAPDISTQQSQNAAISAGNAKNMLKIIDLISYGMQIDILENFYTQDALERSREIKDEEE